MRQTIGLSRRAHLVPSRSVRLLVLTALLAATVLVQFAAVAPAARASGVQDSWYISYLRSAYGFSSSQATDAELTQILDSPDVGEMVRADLACSYHGAHALDQTAADEDVLNALLSELGPTLDGSAFATYVVGEVLAPAPMKVQILTDVLRALDDFHTQLHTFVDALAQLYSDRDYRELLSEYHGFESDDGMSADEAAAELMYEFQPVMSGVEHTRQLSEQELLDQFEYSSQCMSFGENSDERAAFISFVQGVASDLRTYSSTGGLVAVPVSGDTLQLVNSGAGTLNDVTLLNASQQGLGSVGSLEPGDDSSVRSSSGSTSDVASVRFSVDGVSGIVRSLSSVKSDLFAGGALALPVDNDPSARLLTLTTGPFAATGTTPTYRWTPGDGTTPGTGSDLTHHYACPGPTTATFTASAGQQSVSRSVSFTIDPPYHVAWTADGGNQVAPNVPLTFRADPSIPTTGMNITWTFGDGGTGSGAVVPHTFTSTGVSTVTMSVSPAGSSCAPLSYANYVQVGRSSDWVPLSGTLPSNMVLNSSVAGYVLNGQVTVAAGRTLTIGPGTNVKAFSTFSTQSGLLVNGSLVVSGTVDAPAVLTSSRDDAAGGHCSCASAVAPARGDWAGINVSGGSVTMDHAVVRWASSGVSLTASGGSASVTASTFSDSSTGFAADYPGTVSIDASTFARDDTGAGFGCQASTGCAYSPSVTNSVFTDIGSYGVSASGQAAPVVDHATFTRVSSAEVYLAAASGRTLVTHTTVTDGPGHIFLYGTSMGTGSIRWGSDLPYVVSGQLTVPAGGELTIPAGGIVKFWPLSSGQSSLLVNGSLVVSGTVDAPAVLTSSRDDSAGGHCSCASAVAPARGDWAGINVSGGSVTMDHAVVRWASTGVSLTASGGSASVTASTFSDSSTGFGADYPGTVSIDASTFARDYTGVGFGCQASTGCAYSPSVTNSTFTDDSTGVSASGSTLLSIHQSSFDPRYNGVQASGSASVDATNNWWGDASGPRPTGLGASVAGSVTVLPYCTTNTCS